MGRARAAANTVGDVVTEMVGNVAGTVVDPKAGFSQLAGFLRRPAVLGALALAAVAFVVGRRRG
ncbi:hypothetical protein [Geodermatophilus sp. TF02-6]|uniref:hypothetical protein n=1 Tax=Geodermatophilus sp. TF02-6 TaxID=2250575 RepID=UPI000DEA6A5D|nr:hypothetical protein [Geodermatophilus sp. TF02-6]